MAKLVEILARELKEWPRGCVSLTQSAFDREVIEDNDAGSPIGFFASERHDESGLYPTVTRAQWEAERARIAANQQATAEAREIAKGREFEWCNPDEELRCKLEEYDKQQAKEDQALWDRVAIGAMHAYMAQPEAIGDVVVEEFVGWGVEVADAFMAARAKRMKGVA